MRSGGEGAGIERTHSVRVKYYIAHRVSIIEERQVAGGRALPAVAYGRGNGQRLCIDCRIRTRHQCGAGIRGEVDLDDGMKLNTIWSHSGLSVDEVEEA